MTLENQLLEINGTSVKVTHILGSSEVDVPPILVEKLVSRDQLPGLGDFLRQRGKNIIFTTGVYDLLHTGHARYVNLARSLGQVLIVGVNTDFSVKKLKGENRPIQDQMKRAEMLSYFGFVDYITFFEENDGAEVIRLLKPNKYLCVEGSWEGDLATKAEVVAMAEVGGEVFTTPRQGPTVSTSAIIERIAAEVGRAFIDDLTRKLQDGFRF